MSSTDPYVVTLAPRVHAFVQPDGGWCLNNAGFLGDADESLLVDTAATERRALLLREAVLAAGLPLPRTVVSTHHHGDHTYGNGVFLPEARIVGHENCRAEQLAAGHQLHLIWPQTDFGRVEILPPSVTYTDRLTVHVAGIEVRVIHPGTAHTTGDSIVHLPEQGWSSRATWSSRAGRRSCRWGRSPVRCARSTCCARSTRRRWCRGTGG